MEEDTAAGSGKGIEDFIQGQGSPGRLPRAAEHLSHALTHLHLIFPVIQKEGFGKQFFRDISQLKFFLEISDMKIFVVHRLFSDKIRQNVSSPLYTSYPAFSSFYEGIRQLDTPVFSIIY